MMKGEAMALCGDEKDKDRLIKRLRRIGGQVEGLCGMVEDDRDCIEVLRQVASVSGALKGVWMQLVGDHLRGCIATAQSSPKARAALIEELVDHLEKLR